MSTALDTLNITTAPVKARKTARRFGSGDTLSTFGWDTAFAINLVDVNKAILKNSSSPSNYTQTKDYGQGVTATAAGTFGPWSMVPAGSSGSMVHMAVPLPQGTLTYTSGGNSQDYPYADGLAIIEIQLTYLPQGPAQGNAGQPLALQPQTAGQGQQKAVTVESIVWNGTPPNPLVNPFLRDVLEDWFNDNLGQFNTTFAVVNVNSIIDTGMWQWVRPTSVGYAYAQPSGNPDPSQCIFAVLCMTENRSNSGASYQIDVNAIPSGAESGFLISGERYLEKVIMNQISSNFEGGISDSDFMVAPGTYDLTNTVELTMEPISAKGHTYTPTISPNDLTISMNSGEITIDIKNAHVNISPGIDLYLDYTVHAGCELLDKGNGQKALGLYDVQPVEHNHTVQVASWVTITEIITGIIVSVIAGAFGANAAGKFVVKAFAEASTDAVGWAASFAAKAVRVACGAIFAGLGATLTSIPSMIDANASQAAESLPAFDPFADAATNAIAWPGSTGVEATSVGVQGAFQVGINPNFVN